MTLYQFVVGAYNSPYALPKKKAWRGVRSVLIGRMLSRATCPKSVALWKREDVSTATELTRVYTGLFHAAIQKDGSFIQSQPTTNIVSVRAAPNAEAPLIDWQ